MSRRPQGRQRPGGVRIRWIAAAAILVALVGAAWWWVAGRSDQPPARAERQEYAPYDGPLTFPEGMQEATPPEIFELYTFAARRPDVMHYVPCFCGCWRGGHKSAYDCYIDEVRPDGTVDIDDMAFT